MDLLAYGNIIQVLDLHLVPSSKSNQVSPNFKEFQFYQSLKAVVQVTRSSQLHFGHLLDRLFIVIHQNQFPWQNYYSESPNSKAFQFHYSQTLDQWTALHSLVAINLPLGQ